MHRRELLLKLKAFPTETLRDEECRNRFIEFVTDNRNCFDRTNSVGHVTGSAWITNIDRSRFLLTFHKKLGMWLQLGGHADGCPQIERVALREAREESGIDSIRLLSNRIFDLDVHPIPAHSGTPRHYHYDVRFLCEADDRLPLVVSRESHDVRWLTAEEIRSLTNEDSVLRMLRRTPVTLAR